MTELRTLARRHHVDRLALGWAAAAWFIFMLAAQLGIPPVDPRLEIESRPLENLGTLALSVPVAAHARWLYDEAPWLSVMTKRPALVDLSWRLLVGVTGLATALLAGQVAPRGVPVLHVAGSWLFGFSLAALASRWLPPRAAITIPLLVFAGMSFLPAVFPFGRNILYNPALSLHLWITVLLLLGFSMSHPAGRRDGP